MRFPVHQLKKTDTNKAIKMKQQLSSPPNNKRRKKPSISESISFVIKGKLSPMKSMITREMKYRRTSRRGSKKEVEECKVEDKLRIGCGMKVESEMTAKKKGGKYTKSGEGKKSLRKDNSDERPLKKNQNRKDNSDESLLKKNQNKSKRKLSVEMDTEILTACKRGRKPKNESISKLEKVNSKRTTTKILRETVNKKNIKKLSAVTSIKAQKNTKISTKNVPLMNDRKTNIRKVKKRNESNEKIKEESLATEEDSSSESEHPLNILSENFETETSLDTHKQEKTGSKKKSSLKKTNMNDKKLKYNATTVLVKKPIVSNKSKAKNKDKQQIAKKSKLHLWSGPKRHRVASLNALAKVHCLYENESRSAILDNLEMIKSEMSSDNSNNSIKEDEIPNTRTLRSVPGLRAIGKHWDMDDGTFSSSDESSRDTPVKAVMIKKPKFTTECGSETKGTSGGDSVGKKRKRNRTEIMMDLKDMVVRKRMASLNATAILAASYSMERRCLKSPKCEDTDSDSEDNNSTKKLKEKKKPIDDINSSKKEDDTNVIEVCATPNKKVSVILNQDTDVTITGVYLNSTTRSTHHEGYCSIAGMQYRISATSHTQTAATAVATETILQPSPGNGSGTGQDNVSIIASKEIHM